MASQIPCNVFAIMIWFAILTCWPQQALPQYSICVPNASKISLFVSKSSLSAPTKTVRVPFFAPVSPPVTGASTTWTPNSFPFVYNSLANFGLEVVKSIQVLPASIQLKITSYTSLTSLGKPTIVQITSTLDVKDSIDSSKMAPAFLACSTLSGCLAYTCTS